MATKITMDLTEKSIDAAIKKLKAYQKDLVSKNEQFVDKLADIGNESINSGMKNVKIVAYTKDGSEVEESYNYSVEKQKKQGDKVSSGVNLVVGGERLLFVEFGAGVTYREPQNPKADELGYGVGTYPGQKHAFSPAGWTFMSDDGEVLRSYGNCAYMPIYNSSVDMRNNIVSLAKKVFGG